MLTGRKLARIANALSQYAAPFPPPMAATAGSSARALHVPAASDNKKSIEHILTALKENPEAFVLRFFTDPTQDDERHMNALSAEDWQETEDIFSTLLYDEPEKYAAVSYEIEDFFFVKKEIARTSSSANQNSDLASEAPPPRSSSPSLTSS